MTELTALAIGAALWSAPIASGQAHWSIERDDPRFDALVPVDAVVELVTGGHDWVEGPVWNEAGACLLFSDIPRNEVLRWDAREGVRVYLEPSGYTGPLPFPGREPGSNGLAFDRDGRLVLAEHGDRRVARLEPDGTKTTLADRYHGKRLNSPNDLAFKSNGDLYFTDPPFGLPGWFEDPEKELDFQGVYRLSTTGDGATKLELVTRALRAPNGLAFSPDESTLYVSNADRANAIWMAFPVREDGSLGEGVVFFDATAWARDPANLGAPDGLEVDAEGNLFAAGPGGVHVFSPEGDHLGSLSTDVAVGNVAFGGGYLYIAASDAIYRVKR